MTTYEHHEYESPDGGYQVLFLCGDRATVLRFDSQQKGKLYIAMLTEIRTTNSSIRADGGLEGIPPKVFKRRVKKWLKLCREFHIMWGDAFLPDDVKFAWNDGEKHVGLPMTIF